MYIVTGANGFIGSNLINFLSNIEKEFVISVDLSDTDTKYISKKKVIQIPADIFYKDIKNIISHFGKPKAIFHEGAISSTTEESWNKLLKYNLSPTLDLIYFCRDTNIPLQYASSASVYGNDLIKEQWNEANKKMNPSNKYAKSKSQIDYVSNLIFNSKKPPMLLQGMRYFNVYGPNEDHKGDQASPYHKFKKELEKTGKIKLFEGSKQFYRDFISVEKLISIKLDAINNYPSGIYDIGTGNPKSFYDVAIEICHSEKYIEWIPMPDNLKEHYQKYTKANMDWYTK